MIVCALQHIGADTSSSLEFVPAGAVCQLLLRLVPLPEPQALFSTFHLIKLVKVPHIDLQSSKFRLVQRPPTTLLSESTPNFAGGARGGWSPVSNIVQPTVCLLNNAAKISTSSCTGRSRMSNWRELEVLNRMILPVDSWL